MIGLLGDSIDEALIQGIAAVAMGSGDLGGKTVTLTENNTYTYNPHDEIPELDGYNNFIVEVDVDDRYDDGYSDGYNAGYTAGQSSVPIIPLNVTVNDTYTAQSGGYSPVVVNVPQSAAVTTQLTAEHNNTYTPPAGYDGYDEVIVNVPVTDFPEYNNLIACQQQIAAKLGLEPPYDCEDIEEAIDELDGYTFPSGTEYSDIMAIVGNDIIVDKTVGKYIVPYFDNTHSWNKHFKLTLYNSDGTFITYVVAWGLGGPLDLTSYEMIINDTTTGNITITVYQSDGTARKTDTYTNPQMIGFGASGNTFGVKNKE